MPIDLFGMILTSALSWGVGRILDVLFTCDYCGQRDRMQIANVQYNNVGCKNCWHEIVQFTNACEYTMSSNKEIGHVVGKFTGGYTVNRDPYYNNINNGWLFFYSAMRARDMLGKQFVVTGEIIDYNTEICYSRSEYIYTPVYSDCRWYDRERLPIKWVDIPENVRDNRIFAIDMKVKSRYGDVLYEDRRLEQLWK